jgi:hypothetical protein
MFSLADQTTPRLAPARVREVFVSKQLNAFEFIEISDDAPAVTEIQTKLLFEEAGKDIEKSVRFRMISEDANGEISTRGKPDSDWVVVN